MSLKILVMVGERRRSRRSRSRHHLGVSSRNAIRSIFREPVTGGLVASEAIRTPSQSVGRTGLEPVTP
jgi:hypothetical protein